MTRVALVSLVIIGGWWLYIFTIKSSPQIDPGDDAQTPPEIISVEGGPEIIFTDDVRSDNKEIDRFVIDFINILLTNDYRAYRTKVTQYRDPINVQTFEEAYGRVSQVEVKGIRKIEDPKELSGMKLDYVTMPAYIVRVFAIFRDGSERDVEIFIFNEHDRWVINH